MRSRLLPILVLLAIFLGACGARSTTVLTVNDDMSGSRHMTLRFERDPEIESYLTGGFEAVDASITKHLPDGLEYSGLTVSETDVVGKFELAFSSVEDYEEKAAALLAAGQVEITPEVTIERSDGGLMTGLYANESFSSEDLLAWIGTGLVADGVIAEEDRDYVLSGSDGLTLIIGGEEIDTESYSALYYDTQEDYTFSNVSLDLTLAGDQVDYRLTLVNYQVVDPTAETVIDDYFAERVPDDVTIEKEIETGNQATYTLTGTGIERGEAMRQLGEILGNPDVELTISEASEGAGVTHTVHATIACGHACNPIFDDVLLTLNGPAQWTATEGSGGLSVNMLSDLPSLQGLVSGEVSATFTQPIELVGVTSTLSVDSAKDLSLETSYEIPAAEAEQFNDALRALFEPATAITTTDEGDIRRYTLLAEGATGAELAENATLQGPVAVEVTETDSGLFTSTHQVRFSHTPMLGSTGLDHAEVTVTLDVGGLGSIENISSGGWSQDGDTISTSLSYVYGEDVVITVSGWTTSGYIILALLILIPLIIIAVIILVLRSKKRARAQYPQYPHGPVPYGASGPGQPTYPPTWNQPGPPRSESQ